PDARAGAAGARRRAADARRATAGVDHAVRRDRTRAEDAAGVDQGTDRAGADGAERSGARRRAPSSLEQRGGPDAAPARRVRELLAAALAAVPGEGGWRPDR